MELQKYKDNCRICLKKYNANKNIFTHIIEGYQQPLADIIFSLFSIELPSYEDFPKFICRKCITEIEAILLFKEDLIRSQDFLLELFRAAYLNYSKKEEDIDIPSHQVNNKTLQGIDVIVKEEIKYASPKSNFKKSDCVERIQRDRSKRKQDRITKNPTKDILHTTSNGSDENKGAIPKLLPSQEDNPGKYPTKNSNENTLKQFSKPEKSQASFLHSLDLISLQDAKKWKSKREPIARTRRDFDFRLPGTFNISKNSRQNARKFKRGKLNTKSTDQLIGRSRNFLSRYGCRKIKAPGLRRGIESKRNSSSKQANSTQKVPKYTNKPLKKENTESGNGLKKARPSDSSEYGGYISLFNRQKRNEESFRHILNSNQNHDPTGRELSVHLTKLPARLKKSKRFRCVKDYDTRSRNKNMKPLKQLCDLLSKRPIKHESIDTVDLERKGTEVRNSQSSAVKNKRTVRKWRKFAQEDGIGKRTRLRTAEFASKVGCLKYDTQEPSEFDQKRKDFPSFAVSSETEENLKRPTRNTENNIYNVDVNDAEEMELIMVKPDFTKHTVDFDKKYFNVYVNANLRNSLSRKQLRRVKSPIK